MFLRIAWVLVTVGLWPAFAGASSAESTNPPAPGFRAEASDPRAIAIADEVMEALGGRAAYDRSRFLRWNFFGRRTHLWDKWTGDLRIEFVDDEGRRVVVCTNLDAGGARVWMDGRPLADAARLEEWARRARSMWNNDSYWLLMPYKLKDSGVALGLGSEATLEDGRAADRLVLTFEGVGDTPQNKYEVLVARDSHLVESWSYFEHADDAQPKLTTPWRDWQTYGEIRLSGDRGERQITDIAVFDRVDPELFEAP